MRPEAAVSIEYRGNVVGTNNVVTALQIARLRSDPHSPARWRVDGTLRNVPEFAKAFDCPKGSPVSFAFPPRFSYQETDWGTP